MKKKKKVKGMKKQKKKGRKIRRKRRRRIEEERDINETFRDEVPARSPSSASLVTPMMGERGPAAAREKHPRVELRFHSV